MLDTMQKTAPLYEVYIMIHFFSNNPLLDSKSLTDGFLRVFESVETDSPDDVGVSFALVHAPEFPVKVSVH